MHQGACVPCRASFKANPPPPPTVLLSPPKSYTKLHLYSANPFMTQHIKNWIIVAVLKVPDDYPPPPPLAKHAPKGEDGIMGINLTFYNGMNNAVLPPLIRMEMKTTNRSMHKMGEEETPLFVTWCRPLLVINLYNAEMKYLHTNHGDQRVFSI